MASIISGTPHNFSSRTITDQGATITRSTTTAGVGTVEDETIAQPSRKQYPFRMDGRLLRRILNLQNLRIHAGFPGAASVYYYCDDMPSVVMYEYQWDAS